MTFYFQEPLRSYRLIDVLLDVQCERGCFRSRSKGRVKTKIEDVLERSRTKWMLQLAVSFWFL